MYKYGNDEDDIVTVRVHVLSYKAESIILALAYGFFCKAFF